MLKFIEKGEISGDGTCFYDVVLDKEYTVREFIKEILKDTREYGYIGIGSMRTAVFCDIKCEFKYGTIISQPIPDEYLDKIIIEATANGGWGRMDYCLKIKEAKNNDK